MSGSSRAVNCPILIVGAGPVGLTMAAHLHAHGLACRVVDKSAQPTDKSKALVLWARTVEMLDSLGIADHFLQAGMFLNGARINSGGRLVAGVQFAAPGTEFPRPLMLAQSDTERLLIEHLGRVGVPVERSVALTAFTDQGDYVAATLRHPDGHDEAVECDWLLGCDGAHSTVRKQLGLEFTGEAEPNDWVLADCRIDGPIPMDQLSLFWHSRGVLVFFPFQPNRCRVVADMGMARGVGHPSDPSLAEVQALVDERGPAGVRLSEPHWLAGFRIHERKVSSYGRGRVFLAGDAAHIHSPAGGQGMNTGMQDAWNLAWKLALVHTGRARPVLLDSYTPERGAVGEMVLQAAGRMTRMAILRNPFLRFLRNQVVGLMGHVSAFRQGVVRYLTELAVHYPNSPLNGESPGAGFASSGIRPGDRMPDTRLKQAGSGHEERLLAVLRGTRHNLLLLPASADGADAASLSEVSQRVEAAYPDVIRAHLILPGDAAFSGKGAFPSVWLDPAATVRHIVGARQTTLVLVRPDGYIGFRGQPATWDNLHAYLDRYLIPSKERPPCAVSRT